MCNENRNAKRFTGLWGGNCAYCIYSRCTINRESVRIHRFFEDYLDRLIQSDPKYKDVGFLSRNGLDGSLKNHDGDFNRMHWDWTIDNPLSGRGTLPIRRSRFFYFTRIVLWTDTRDDRRAPGDHWEQGYRHVRPVLPCIIRTCMQCAFWRVRGIFPGDYTRRMRLSSPPGRCTWHQQNTERCWIADFLKII